MENIIKLSETEYMAGNSRIEIIDNDIILSTPVGPHTIDQAKALNNIVIIFQKQIQKKVNVAIDLNKSEKSTLEAKKFWKDFVADDAFGKIAFFGLHPVARVLATFEMGSSKRKNKMRFFKTKEETFNWLRE